MTRLPLRTALVPALAAMLLFAVAFPLAAHASPAATAGIDSLVQQPGPEGKDACGWLTYPNTNYGADAYYYAIGLPDRGRAYLEFDLAGLPGDAQVLSARLELWAAYGNGDLTIEPVASAWNELTLTWNNMPGVVSPAIAVTYPVSRGTPSGDCYWGCTRSFDVTPIVSAWVNGTIAHHGFRVLANTANIGNLMASMDGTSYPRPKLSITFESATPAVRPSWGALKTLYR